MLPPVFDPAGMRVISLEPGRAILELDAAQRHWNHAGVVHGGILSVLADSAMGPGASQRPAAPFATIKSKMNFLAKIAEGRLIATAGITSSGRTLTMLECEIRDQGDRLLAKASSACVTPQPRTEAA